jgi:hypothetical protein
MSQTSSTSWIRKLGKNNWMFVKPLPRFLFDVATSEEYLLCQAVSCSPDILCDCYLCRKRTLRFLFSYTALIVHQSDFYIARDAHPDTLREQDGECEGSPTAGVQPQQEQTVSLSQQNLDTRIAFTGCTGQWYLHEFKTRSSADMVSICAHDRHLRRPDMAVDLSDLLLVQSDGLGEPCPEQMHCFKVLENVSDCGAYQCGAVLLQELFHTAQFECSSAAAPRLSCSIRLDKEVGTNHVIV